jgi:hypothetical protein
VYAQWVETDIITTAADGSATGYTPVASGKILAIRYAKTDYADGVDLVVTVEGTGEAVVTLTDMNAATVVYPRVAVQNSAGANALYAAAGETVKEAVCIAHDRLKLVLAAGGNVKSGKFYALIGG